MLASGREQTRAEYEELLAGAGFILNHLVETIGPMCVLKALPNRQRKLSSTVLAWKLHPCAALLA